MDSCISLSKQFHLQNELISSASFQEIDVKHNRHKFSFQIKNSSFNLRLCSSIFSLSRITRVAVKQVVKSDFITFRNCSYFLVQYYLSQNWLHCIQFILICFLLEILDISLFLGNILSNLFVVLIMSSLLLWIIKYKIRK